MGCHQRDVLADLDFVIAAALVMELTSRERLRVSGDGKRLQVSVQDSTPLGVRISMTRSRASAQASSVAD